MLVKIAHIENYKRQAYLSLTHCDTKATANMCRAVEGQLPCCHKLQVAIAKAPAIAELLGLCLLLCVLPIMQTGFRQRALKDREARLYLPVLALWPLDSSQSTGHSRAACVTLDQLWPRWYIMC